MLYLQCSEEVVVLGILRVVEEILERRPDARVVINSIFPMTVMRGGLYPVISDIEDSFIRLGNDRSLAAIASSVDPEVVRWQSDTNGVRRFLLAKQLEVPVQRPHKMSDEEEAAAAEKDEELRDKMAKGRKGNRQPIKRNPVMKDSTKVRKYDPGRVFLRQSAKPLWTSIRSINKELRKFAEKHDRVIFFDATDLMVEKVGKSYVLLTDRISTRGHLTERGFAVWEDEIVKCLEQIFVTMKREQPDLFGAVPAVNVAADEKEGIQNGRNDDDFVKQGDDLDDKILHANDDGFGHTGYDEDEEAKSSDDANSGDLQVAVVANATDVDEGNS